MGVFDQSARYATEAEPEWVVRRMLRGQGLALHFREWVESRPTPKPGDPEWIADRVAALDDERAPNQPWLMPFEFQSSHDPDKLDTTLLEVAQLRVLMKHGPDRKGKYRVLATFVYLAGRCPEAELRMTTATGEGSLHRPLLWEVEGDDASGVLDEVARDEFAWGALFWIALMRGADDPAIIARWKELASAQPPARRADLKQIAITLAELPGRLAIWRKELEDWDVFPTESTYLNELLEKPIMDARLEEARKCLLTAVETRFPTAPPEVLELLQTQSSQLMVEKWFRAALTAGSLDEFVAYLRR